MTGRSSTPTITSGISSSGRYSWLTDGPREVVFGSTAPLIRDYLLDDYLADMAGINLVKSVHIQASFLEDDPAAETRWLQGIADERGFPHGIVAHARLEEPDAEAVLEAHCVAGQHARYSPDPELAPEPGLELHRARRPDAGCGVAAWLRPAATARSRLRHDDLFRPARRRFGPRQRFPRHADHRQPHRQPCRPGRRRHRGLALRDERAGRRRQRRGQDLRPRRLRPQLDHGEHAALHPPHHRRLRHRALHVRERFPGGRIARRRRCGLRVPSRPSSWISRRPSSARSSTSNAVRLYRLD